MCGYRSLTTNILEIGECWSRENIPNLGQTHRCLLKHEVVRKEEISFIYLWSCKFATLADGLDFSNSRSVTFSRVERKQEVPLLYTRLVAQ